MSDSAFGSLSPPPVFRPVYRNGGKRLLDLFLVLLAAPLLLPLLAALVLLVRASGGPAFFAQDRLGKDGRVFRCWKLRTMVVGAEQALARHLEDCAEARAEWDAHQKLHHDPRITPVGRILRQLSFDEIPQLWNVVRGDMSLVGPRPMLPEQYALYPGRSYLGLRPGLTGTWQVSARHTSVFAERGHFDDQYAEELSLWTDLRVISETFFVVLKATGQ